VTVRYQGVEIKREKSSFADDPAINAASLARKAAIIAGY
jgi:hypothetical protein